MHFRTSIVRRGWALAIVGLLVVGCSTKPVPSQAVGPSLPVDARWLRQAVCHIDAYPIPLHRLDSRARRGTVVPPAIAYQPWSKLVPDGLGDEVEDFHPVNDLIRDARHHRSATCSACRLSMRAARPHREATHGCREEVEETASGYTLYHKYAFSANVAHWYHAFVAD